MCRIPDGSGSATAPRVPSDPNNTPASVLCNLHTDSKHYANAETSRDRELIDRLVGFLQDYYREDLGELADHYPTEQRSVTIDYDDLFRFDPDVAHDHLERPGQMREYLEDAVRSFDLPAPVELADVNVRVTNLPDGALLRELYSASELSYILIGNDADGLLGPVDDQLRSRIRSGLHVPFDQYSHETLVAILERRAAALTSDTVSAAQLEWIADAAAGEAREAIAILRQAARSAGRDGEAQVADGYIDDNIEAARATLRQKSLERLSYHQRVVYDVLSDHDWIAPIDLISEYEDRVDDPRSGRTVRSYLAKLDRYNLAEWESRGQAKKYRAIEP